MKTRLVQLHHGMIAAGRHSWQQHLLFLLLVPLGVCYGIIALVRDRCYRFGLLPVYRTLVPVLSVGNLAVGGAGKTPCVDWLVKRFQQEGRRPAIASRGYGGCFSGRVGVVSMGDGLLMTAAEAGDEPVLLARRNPACPVLIGRKRRDVVRYIEESGCADLIILDDGFQHRAVARDVDLVLIDGRRPLGNGWPLPAGNLREFPGALARADLLLRTRVGEEPSACRFGRPTYNSRHQLADVAVCLTGEQMPLRALQGLKLAAFAGIADPRSFFSALEQLGLDLTEKITLPDHVTYSAQQIDGLQAVAERIDAYVTTEKDAVKLAPGLLRRPCYQVPMMLDVDNGDDLIAAMNSKLWSTS